MTKDIIDDTYKLIYDIETKRVKMDVDTFIKLLTYDILITKKIINDAKEIKQIIIELYNQQKI